MRPRRLGAEEATGAGTHSTSGGMARAVPISVNNSGEVKISVSVACTACWTAWAVAALTAAATDSVRASDRPSKIVFNRSISSLKLLRVRLLVVGFMIILRVVLKFREVARPDAQPRSGRSDSDRVVQADREGPASPLLAHPPRNTVGLKEKRRRRSGVSWRRAHRQGRAGRRSGRIGSGLSRPSPPRRWRVGR